MHCPPARESAQPPRPMLLSPLSRFGILASLTLAFVAASLRAQSPSPVPLPAGISYVTSVEGINEYRLPNGLRVLLFADPSKSNITVNITYLVGSRHEDYGET